MLYAKGSLISCHLPALTDSPQHLFHSELHYIDGCLKPFRETQWMFYRRSAHAQHQKISIVHTFNARDDFTMGFGEEYEYIPLSLVNILNIFLHWSWTSNISSKES